MKFTTVLGTAVLVAALAFAMWPAAEQNEDTSQLSDSANSAMADVVLPELLSQNAQIGKRAFEASCASCHGISGAGKNGIAPPLVHKIYEPSHHGDESFQRAAAMGVQAHHWNFGNMPAVEGITRGEVTLITTYIRELQRANGIN